MYLWCRTTHVDNLWLARNDRLAKGGKVPPDFAPDVKALMCRHLLLPASKTEAGTRLSA